MAASTSFGSRKSNANGVEWVQDLAAGESPPTAMQRTYVSRAAARANTLSGPAPLREPSSPNPKSGPYFHAIQVAEMFC
jgi:hypothetical protein